MRFHQITFAVMVVVLLTSPVFAQKKPKPAPEPPKTYPTARTFAASCDAVWPAALRAVTSNGWGVKTSDRAGGIITMEYTLGEYHGAAKGINEMVRRYTVEKSTGFWTTYSGFRVVSGQFIAMPERAGCSVAFTLVYHGREIRVGQGDGWWILRSNGFFEDKMLGEIENALRALKGA